MNLITDELQSQLDELQANLKSFKYEITTAEEVLITMRSPMRSFLAYITVGVFIHELEPPTYALTFEAFNVKKNEPLSHLVKELSPEGHGVSQISVLCTMLAEKFDSMESARDDCCDDETPVSMDVDEKHDNSCSPKKPRMHQEKQEQPHEKNEISEKLPRMKTASEVVKRVEWDEQLPRGNFLVGYVDRFLGVVEKPFSSFDWNADLCDVEHNSNPSAIPEHRIQYFKYKDEKVWDKNERLDLIFGSTGNEKRIHDIIAELGTDQFDFMKYASNFEKEEIVQDIYKVDWALKREETCRAIDHVEPLEQVDDTSVSTGTSETNTDEKAPPKLKPNYFFSFRIENQEIADYHSEFCRKYFNIYPASVTLNKCTPVKLHITLGLLRIDKVREFELAIQLMSDIDDLDLLSPLQLPIEVDTSTMELTCFNDQVAVIELQSDSLQLLNSKLIELCEEYELKPVVDHSFRPHITLIKFREKDAKFEKSFLESPDCPQMSFPEKLVLSKVSLCSMGETQEDGFYRIVSEFGKEPNSAP